MKKTFILIIILISSSACNIADPVKDYAVEIAFEKIEQLTARSHTPDHDSTEYVELSKWEEYCEKYSVEYITEPERTVADIERIVWPIMESFNYKTDMSQWLVSDQWDPLTDDTGDCEDYAISLQSALINAGFPLSDALMAIGNVESDGITESHMVIIAKANLGELYVCDDTGVTRFKDYKIEWLAKQDESGKFFRKYFGEKNYDAIH